MWHVETFNSRGQPGEMEALLRRALPYWRSRGFHVKVFISQFALGPAQFWLLTQLDSFDAFERWPAMATSETEGQTLMDEFLQLADCTTASLVSELDT
jgi:hypothetical protein